MARGNSIGNGSFIALLLIVVGVYLGYEFLNGGINLDKLSSSNSSSDNSVHALLTDNQLVYTKHAKCRMGCRTISKSEVEHILKNGKVNDYKSDKHDKPCPSYALEGKTNDGQTVRIVFADCNNATKVVTAIDLENNYKCNCN